MLRILFLFVLLIPLDVMAQHARILLHDRSVKVQNTGLSYVTDSYRIKILDRKGAAAFEVLRLDYDPATNVVKFLSVQVRHNGTIRRIDLSKVIDLPQPQRWIYWGTMMKLISVPLLKPGDVLEYQTRKKGFTIAYLNGHDRDERYIPPMRGHYYEVVNFTGSYPCDLMRYSLFIPKGKQIQFAVYHGELTSSRRMVPGGTQYVWTAKDLPALPDEPDRVDPSDVALKLVLTTVPDWQMKSRWFYNVNKDQFKANAAIQAKVDQVIKGAKTDMEKARRLLRWVAANIRYAGISMGKGEGYTLHSGVMTFHDRCGVCKDIAGMLITMMRAAKLDAYPAMTMAGAKVEDIPADQFDHCVVVWRQKDGSFIMLDPTWAPASSLLWCNAEFNQDFLIGTPEGQTLMQTPYVPPQSNTLSVTAKTRLDRKGTLTSVVRIRGTGYADTRLRRNFVYRPHDQWKQEFEAMVRDISPAGVLTSWHIGALKDLDRPLVLTFKYKVKHWALSGKSSLTMRIPLASPLFASNHRFSPFLSVTKKKKRKTPAWFWATWRYKVHESIDMPGGFRLHKPVKKHLKGGGAKADIRMTQKRGKLTYNAVFSFGKRILKPKNYAAFKAVTDLMRAGHKTWVMFGGGR